VPFVNIAQKNDNSINMRRVAMNKNRNRDIKKVDIIKRKERPPIGKPLLSFL
jgi:hypothetical protein